MTYPKVELELVGTDGNAFAIMGNVTRAMKKQWPDHGLTPDQIKKGTEAYTKQATSGDYDNLLVVSMQWLDGKGVAE